MENSTVKSGIRHKEIETVLPFKENHIDKQAVFEILENSGLGLQKYDE